MNEYKEMYLMLFNKVSDTIKELQEIQQKTEEIYISQENSPIMDIKKSEQKVVEIKR